MSMYMYVYSYSLYAYTYMYMYATHVLYCLCVPPQSFKLENKATGAFLYAGVLDFTSVVAEQAYIPQWMMDHLGAIDGVYVCVSMCVCVCVCVFV